MDLFDKMTNIKGINIEDVIIRSIEKIKLELFGLTKNRTCKIYSSYLLNELNSNHVICRLINTLELGSNYEHEFILVNEGVDNYFLIDLTFLQFGIIDDKFKNLLTNGYMKITNKIFLEYLKIVTLNDELKYASLNDIFFLEKDKSL